LAIMMLWVLAPLAALALASSVPKLRLGLTRMLAVSLGSSAFPLTMPGASEGAPLYSWFGIAIAFLAN
jgi:hypothetical protein